MSNFKKEYSFCFGNIFYTICFFFTSWNLNRWYIFIFSYWHWSYWLHSFSIFSLHPNIPWQWTYFKYKEYQTSHLDKRLCMTTSTIYQSYKYISVIHSQVSYFKLYLLFSSFPRVSISSLFHFWYQEPNTYDEEIKDDSWRQAIDEEIKDLELNIHMEKN